MIQRIRRVWSGDEVAGYTTQGRLHRWLRTRTRARAPHEPSAYLQRLIVGFICRVFWLLPGVHVIQKLRKCSKSSVDSKEITVGDARCLQCQARWCLCSHLRAFARAFIQPGTQQSTRQHACVWTIGKLYSIVCVQPCVGHGMCAAVRGAWYVCSRAWGIVCVQPCVGHSMCAAVRGA